MTELLFENVPSDWEVTTLGDVCARTGGGVQTGPFGSQLHASDYVPSGIPSIMPENLSEDRISTEGIAYITPDDAERLKRYRVRTGDIIYSRRGDVTKRAHVGEQNDGWLCGTGCLRVRFGGGEVDPRFAFYYTGHPLVKEWVSRHAIGATLPNLNTSILSALPFLFPRPNEQTAIAKILGALDDKIDLNRRMNGTLGALARAIFKSLFVDFDPVRAKAEGRDSHLPKGLTDLFPRSFDDSELGPIPKEWAIGSILVPARLLSGGTPKTDREEYWNGDIVWASAKDVSQCRETFLVETERSITERGLVESATQMMPRFCTVVVARGATTGRMTLLGREMAMNQTCYALETKSNTPFALYCLLRNEIEQLVHAAHGSVFDTITTDTFARSRVVLPPERLMEAFEMQVGPLFQRILANTIESATLAATRDLLLPKLISGEIRVNHEEISSGGTR